MSNYTKTTDFSAKDALSTGDPNKIVSGTGIDTEFDNIQTSNNTKADKAVPATANNMARLDSNGNLSDSGFLFSGTGGTCTSSAAELSTLTGVTASTGDINACTNFEETISATTLEVSIATGKTLNIVDDGAGLEFNGTALTATVAELNYADGPNTASKFCLLDSSAEVPQAQHHIKWATSEFTTNSITAGSYADYTQSGYGGWTPYQISAFLDGSEDQDVAVVFVDDAGRYTRIKGAGHDTALGSALPTTASTDQINFRIYNDSVSDQTVYIRIMVRGF